MTQILRGDAYDASIDVYSYGITMWELFNFEKPFKDIESISLPFLVTGVHCCVPVCLLVSTTVVYCAIFRVDSNPTTSSCL